MGCEHRSTFGIDKPTRPIVCAQKGRKQMAKIYVSYSRKDGDFMRALVNRLKQEGHEITVDDDVLTAGRDWRSTLDEGLKSADVFLTLLSHNTPTSAYTMMELGAARAFAGATGTPLVIPIAIDQVEVPLVLQDIQILFASDRDVDAIVAEISKSISSQHGLSLAREVKAEVAATRIKQNAPQYIDEAIKAQDAIKRRNACAARGWYAAGFLALLSGIAVALWTFVAHASVSSDWLSLARAVVVNVVVVGFLGACSRYAFSLGKSYTTEALKASDRIHAIMFGRFYLNAFPDRVTWTELKEVFANWNIDRSSAFAQLDVAQIDPQLISMITQVVTTAVKKKD